jgi:ATP-dependent RNA helicase SUPV3L1/SUV3
MQREQIGKSGTIADSDTPCSVPVQRLTGQRSEPRPHPSPDILMPYRPRSKAPGAGVTAILGPTNTGKTYMAIERMMTHETGVIGLPLRLLAREVYLKLCDRAGAEQVALVTGEEKIVPFNPRFWVSTVEAMPRDLDVDFVCVDEVQLATNLERGHVFTDRILNVRGKLETMLLGADTMRGLLAQLLPGIQIIQRPRLSLLAYTGSKKITRQPRRTAVVAFSANDVYAIAELIRRQRGGAAVVLGALSPRTRNAQVDLYQNGDVDFLVATDAIGMGLNLDVDHVAFAGRHKFDGFDYRELTAAEMGQIAGRAGRHLRDGTFGVTARTAPLDDYLIEKLETHSFEPVRRLQWRNANLDFSSVDALRDALDEIPGHDLLTRALPQEDADTFEGVLRDKTMRARASSEDRVRLLWEACQLPDYRKIAPAQHIEIVAQLFAYLADHGRVNDDWMATQLRNTDRIDGDIDALSARIAHVRTWTFVANRKDWLDDPLHWQERTRALEDRLSDALHEKLTQRFVDRRTSVLMRRLREKAMLEATIASDGDVQVEGQHVGWLSGFRFTPDATAEDQDAKAVRAAAQKVLASEIQRRAEKLALSDDGAFVLDTSGSIRWTGEVVAKLSASDDILKPKRILLADEHLTGGAREAVDARLEKWLDGHIAKHLQSLIALRSGDGLEGIARGIGFRLAEELGHLDRRAITQEVKDLDQDARATLRKHGVRFGAYALFVPGLLKPAPAGLLALLWALQNGGLDQPGLADLPQLNASGRTSIPIDHEVDSRLYPIAGFRVCGKRGVRFDILERLADLIRPLVGFRPGQSSGDAPVGAADGNGFMVTVEMTSLLGCAGDDFSEVLKSLGYKLERRTVPIEPTSQAEAGNVAEATDTHTEDGTADPGTETASSAATAEDDHPGATTPAEDGAPGSIEPEPTTNPEAQDGNKKGQHQEALTEEPAADLVVAGEPTEEPTEQVVEIWRPAPNRPRQQGRPDNRRRDAQSGGPETDRRQGKAGVGHDGAGKSEGGRAAKRGKPRRNHKHQPRDGDRKGPRDYSFAPQKKDKRADPDSPFAALAGLLDNTDKNDG